MQIQFIHEGPALLLEGERRILTVADLHFGIESDMARHGIHIQSNAGKRLERLCNCIHASDPDLLVILGDLKHRIPSTSRQEYREIPYILDAIRDLVPVRLCPGNHDVGIARYLRDDELLPVRGGVIDGCGFYHGHTYPDPALQGRLIFCGHCHPTVSIRDEVGYAVRGAPAYLYTRVDEERLFPGSTAGDTPTRLMFVPAFNELAGGINVTGIPSSGLGPATRCLKIETTEVMLKDGSLLGTLDSISRHPRD
ncbi:MAG: metallophosphoesterase [Methanoculleaceae archaeon]